MKRILKLSLLIFLLINCSSLTLRGSIIDTSVVKKRHHHKQQAQSGSNFTLDAIGAKDLSNNPVIKKANAEKAQLYNEQIYKPGTTDLIQGRGINIDKADLDKYSPNGVNLQMTNAQIQAQIDELKQEELYKNIGIGAPFLIIAIIVWVYIKKRPTKKALL